MPNKYCPNCGRPEPECPDETSCKQFNNLRDEYNIAEAKINEWRRIIGEVGYISSLERDFAEKIAQAYPNPPTKDATIPASTTT